MVGGEKVMLKCRGNVDEDKTEAEKNRSYLSMPSNNLSVLPDTTVPK